MAVLRKHSGKEFEVQIREGCISQEGQETLSELGADFEVLQVSLKLYKMITEVCSFANQDILAVLDEVVKTSLIKVFENTLHGVQKGMRKARRVDDNRLVRENVKLVQLFITLQVIKSQKSYQNLWKTAWVMFQK